MDVGGSFLELACVRIAVVPAGPLLPDARYEELTAHLTAFREIPVNALPRRPPAAPPPRSQAVAQSASFSTIASMTPALRAALKETSPNPLSRSYSAMRQLPRSSTAYPSRQSLAHSGSSASLPRSASISAPLFSPPQKSAPLASPALSSLRADPTVIGSIMECAPPPTPRFNADLDLKAPEVDATFRMHFDVVHRDGMGALIMRPITDWDDFHSTKVWGVFGIVDATNTTESKRDDVVARAALDFRASLVHFKHAAVRRLIIFVPPDPDHSRPFVLNSATFAADSSDSLNLEATRDINAQFSTTLPFSIGHVPERPRAEDTKLEARAQVVHFAGLLLHEIDLECWRRRESPSSQLFLSPLDENASSDRQSKLAKRRLGRLDKLLGDSLLLMGNPADALLKYSSAIERSKASSDRLWLASAMEGWSAAHVLSHIGNGGTPDDSALVDKIIEHYAEIFKLYQKKRVAEPEAAAAMRLAEFLSLWTSRRKEALDAALHAATVGEGLRTPKRAALWEAFARFSDRMGYRRKAAMYLYRLGELNASQAVSSSAVTLMVAAERQLCKSGRKPWALLNRRILFIAARHAEEAGDSQTSARLYAEALAITSVPLRERQAEDEIIIGALSKANVPSYLPSASSLLFLSNITACAMDGLSVQLRNSTSNAIKTDRLPRDGPFIYNPFEARKRAKAEAASRSVTWVCDESAFVSLRLVSHVGAELVTEVVAVLVRKPSETNEDLSNISSLTEKKIDADKNSENSEMSESRTTLDSMVDGKSVSDEDEQTVQHALLVQQELECSSEVLQTNPDSLMLHPNDPTGSTKYITVIPRQSGSVTIVGILVRLFNNALIILQSENENTSISRSAEVRVDVMERLPRVNICVRAGEGEYGNESVRANVMLFDGERRSVDVEACNSGTEKIARITGKVLVEDGAGFVITRDELGGQDVVTGLESMGEVRTFQIEFLGQWRGSRSQSQLEALISVGVEYESFSTKGIVRESFAQIRVICRKAVSVGRVVMFHRANSTSSVMMQTVGNSELCMAVEVTNHISIPAKVAVVQRWGNFGTDMQADNRVIRNGENGEETLVEHCACVRLVTPLLGNMKDFLRRAVLTGWSADMSGTVVVQWALPSMGRSGMVATVSEQLRKAAILTWGVAAGSAGRAPLGWHGRQDGVRATVRLHISPNIVKAENNEREAHLRTTDTEDFQNEVSTGTVYPIKVEVANDGLKALPPSTVFDIDFEPNAGRTGIAIENRGYLTGSLSHVFVGPILPGESFEHTVNVCVNSVGIVEVTAYVYDEIAQLRIEGSGDSAVADASNISGTNAESLNKSDKSQPRVEEVSSKNNKLWTSALVGWAVMSLHGRKLANR